MSIIKETSYNRILEILVGGLPYYYGTTTGHVWDPERKKFLNEIIEDLYQNGGGGGGGGPILWANILNKPNSVSGYNIQDVYTKSEVNSLIQGISPGNLLWENIQNKPGWIGSTKPSYTASEVGALPSNTDLFSGNYLDLSNRPTLGTLSSKNQVSIIEISATGTPSGSNFLSGDGTWKAASGSGGGNWGSISGNIAAQTDLATALLGKVDKELGKVLSDINYSTLDKNKLDGILAGAQVNTVASVSGKTGVVSLTKSDVGLGSVDNTSDAGKPISTLTQAALNGKANTIHTHEIDLISDFPERGTLVAGANITITESGSDITISSTGGGGGSSIHNDLTGRSTANAHPITAITGLQPLTSQIESANTLVAGTNVTLTQSGSDLVISASGSGGGGSSVHSELTGREAANSHPIGAITGLQPIADSVTNADTLVAGTNITLTSDGGNLVISSSGGGGGGSSVHNDLTGRELSDSHPISAITGLESITDQVEDASVLLAGNNITLTDTGGTLVISAESATEGDSNTGFDAKVVIPEGGGILGLGASFMAGDAAGTGANNSWFHTMAGAVNAAPFNQAQASNGWIGLAANMLRNGTVLGTGAAPIADVDAVLLMYTHEVDCFILPAPFDTYTVAQYEASDILPFPTLSPSITQLQVAQAWDYTIKKIRQLFFNSKNTAVTYQGAVASLMGTNPPKPAQIILCTHWHDARPVFNDSIRKLADKWDLPLVQFDKKIGFSKDVPSVNGIQPSIEFVGNVGGHSDPLETIEGTVYGWHPMTGSAEVYIQKKMAEIAVESFDKKGGAELVTANLVEGSNITLTALPNGDIQIASSGGGGGGTTIHNDLTGRNSVDAHPISAITGLSAVVDQVEGGNNLVAGSNIILTPDGNDIVISATGGGGGGTYTGSTSITLTGSSFQRAALTGDVTSPLNSNATTLSNTGVTAGTYNNVATSVRPFTVDAKGRITSVGTAVTIAPSWGSVGDKPATFAPSAHNHAAGEITSGTLDIGRIPTGATASTVSLGNHTHTEITGAADLNALPGYNAAVKQYLTHDASGALRWENS